MNARVKDQVTADAVAASPSGELDSLLRTPSARKAIETAAVRIGRIVTLDANGAPSVDFPGSGGTPVAARLAIATSAAQLQAALESGQPVVLLFENGDAALPVIAGFIQSAPSPAVAQPAEAVPQMIEADVDGKRVRIVAQDEIVLQCGAASVTLRRNGRVVIRGTYVETYSEGTNRIKGGQVRIN